MTPIRQHLLDLIEDREKAFGATEHHLAPLRLEAAQEVFEERRAQIPLLAKRAADAGITRVTSFDDLVPLLFAHTTYKSYPASFIEQGRWDRMLTWLNTLSVRDVTGVDVAGVVDVDDWLDRLWAEDHRIICTSGTTGKCSFLNHTADDQERKRRHFKHVLGWPHIQVKRDKMFFWLGPVKGYNSAVEAAQINIQNVARPGGAHWLSDAPLSMAEVSRMAVMRKKMADGSATPEDIKAFETRSLEKGRQGEADLEAFADLILDHRHEPMYLTGLWAQHMAVIRRARDRGIPDDDFHPDSIIGAGGGVKAVPLPADYKEQVRAFYGLDHRPSPGLYAMTELAQAMPRCEAGRYHIAPGLIPLFLNEAGDRLIERPHPAAVIEARFGFLDLLYDGRWGGLITGDKVQVDVSPVCACGRPGPVILDTITRYAQPGKDDHIGCAGTIDAYIKGVVA